MFECVLGDTLANRLYCVLCCEGLGAGLDLQLEVPCLAPSAFKCWFGAYYKNRALSEVWH